MIRRSLVRRGMTLIELSIVVAILGVIFSGIFGAYYAALKISRDSDPRGGTTRKEIFFALENLRSTFSQTFYVTGHKRLIFEAKNETTSAGRADSVTFAANHTNSEETGSPAIREVSYFLRQMCDDCEYYYLMRREDEMVDADPRAGGTEHMILSHVKSFQLKYSQRGDKWQDEWSSADLKKIPKLIRIELIAVVGETELKYETLAYPGLFFK
ncbi:MAG: prepilin-type N-terminal cleavage/methylation domain-containing protein [Leptospiraceae bacterium]|nr:prepilin-type N-terminal cleavage/methylation domain-containing protein [Leptospiraceae bacterium]